MKPHVDALEMESMLAFGKQADLFAIGQLREADCTFKATLFLELFRIKDRNRQGAKYGWIKGRTSESRLMGNEHEAARAIRAGRARVPLRTEVEDESEDENDED